MNAQFSKLNWLKRTHGHKFTGAELRVLLSIFNHSGADGRKSHPGLKLMTEETGYGKAAVSGAVSSLKARGWIRETYRGSGVSGNASVFDLVPDAPNSLSSSPVGEQPTGRGSSSADEQLTGSSSPTADRLFASSVEVVRLETNPSDPGTDPKIRSSRRSVDRPSDPGEVHHPVNHRGITETTSGLGDMPEDKTAELSPGEDETQSESEPGWESVSLFGIPESAPAEHFTPWPADKPLPNPRDPFTTYVDETTGEPLAVQASK